MSTVAHGAVIVGASMHIASGSGRVALLGREVTDRLLVTR